MSPRKKQGRVVIILITTCILTFCYMALAATRPAYPFGAIVPVIGIIEGLAAFLVAAYPGPAGA